MFSLLSSGLFIFLIIFFCCSLLHGLYSVDSRACPLVEVCGCLIEMASLVAKHRFWGVRASVVADCRPRSCDSGL